MDQLANPNKGKINLTNERNNKEGNKAIKSDLNSKAYFNNINNFLKVTIVFYIFNISIIKKIYTSIIIYFINKIIFI